MQDQIHKWEQELKELMATPHFAFAMGHGCSMGFMPTESRAVLQRAGDLCALIKEHRQ